MARSASMGLVIGLCLSAVAAQPVDLSGLGGPVPAPPACGNDRFFNTTTAACECIQGLTPNACAGPTKGACGLYNGA
jgi:hypothetical protein